MNNVIAVVDNVLLKTKEVSASKKNEKSLFKKLKNNASLLLIAIMFVVGTVLAIGTGY